MVSSDILQQVIESFALALEGQKLCDSDESFREARLLMAEGLQLTPIELLGHLKTPLKAFPSQDQKRLALMQNRRLKGEPLSRIRGTRGFWKETFFISEATLDPRPETEGLIDIALTFFEGRPPPERMIDLGTGTGCLLLSLLKEFPQSHGIGIDLSEEALKTAQKNALSLREESRCLWRQGHWMTDIEGMFDLVVTNPPYIPSDDVKSLEPGVRLFDPLLALDGGKDGLDAYRQLIPQVARHLSTEGLFLLEIGIGQQQDLTHLLNPFFEEIVFTKDLGKIVRYAQVTKPKTFASDSFRT